MRRIALACSALCLTLSGQPRFSPAPAPESDPASIAPTSPIVGDRAAASSASSADAFDSDAAPAPPDAEASERPPTPLVSHTSTAISCGAIAPGGAFSKNFIAPRDLTTSFIDGDDLLAEVNRSPIGALASDYTPRDLVHLFSGERITAHDCETRSGPCLRRDAAAALKRLLAALASKGMVGHVESAYRGYQTQCATFLHWAINPGSSFCSAADQSALAGHSQHQLGTTIDLFTEEWVREGKATNAGAFRNGFACTPAGRWLEDNSWQYGFVVAYPIHPDDRQKDRCRPRWDKPVFANPRTGYKQEPWHLRFIGDENAAAFHAAWLASGPDTPAEITLEQWLRAKSGRRGDADLPVCNGCECDACATLDTGNALETEKKLLTPCGDGALLIDATGRPRASDVEPKLLDAKLTVSAPDGGSNAEPLLAFSVRVAIAPHTVTQPPIAPVFAAGETFDALVPYPQTLPHRYDDLPGAWRIGIEPVFDSAAPPATTPPRFPWRASLAKEHLAANWNRANLYLPAGAGDTSFRIAITPPVGARAFRVTLLRDGVAHGMRIVER